jgi:hypothetical protein
MKRCRWCQRLIHWSYVLWVTDAANSSYCTSSSDHLHHRY